MTVSLTLERPWLSLDLAAPHRVLSWAINKPGFASATRILWREVRNADLPAELDVDSWLATELAARDAADAVVFLTSRDVSAYHQATARVGGATVVCVATTGLSNAEHVGARVDRSAKSWGTINIAIVIDQGLTDAARIETLAIAAQARTVAVMSVGLPLPTGLATGTGTDCIAVAAPEGEIRFAGMHTDIGEATGKAVHEAVVAGAREWMATVRREED